MVDFVCRGFYYTSAEVASRSASLSEAKAATLRAVAAMVEASCPVEGYELADGSLYLGEVRELRRGETVEFEVDEIDYPDILEDIRFFLPHLSAKKPTDGGTFVVLEKGDVRRRLRIAVDY